MSTLVTKWMISYSRYFLYFSFSLPGPQQALRGLSGRPVRGQNIHHQDGSDQPEAGRDRGHSILRLQETVWAQRRGGDSCVGVPAAGQSRDRDARPFMPVQASLQTTVILNPSADLSPFSNGV